MRGFEKVFVVVKSVFKNLQLSILAVVLFFGLLEGAARIYMSFSHSLYEHEIRIEEQNVKVDNKRNDEKRIFVIGESAVQGVPMDMDHSMVAYLSKLLSKQGYPNIKTINLGIAGRHSFYHQKYTSALIRYGADGVILYAGNNDTMAESAALRDIFLARLDFELTYFSKFYYGLKRKLLILKEKMNERIGDEIFNTNPNQDQRWTASKQFKNLETRQQESTSFARDRFEKSIQYYESNLNSLVKKLRKRNIPVWIMELPIVHEANSDSFDWSLNKMKSSSKLKFENKEDQESWTFWLEKGLGFFNSKTYHEAKVSFEKAYQIYSNSNQLQNLLYQTYLQLKENKKAKDILKDRLLMKNRVRGGHPKKTKVLKKIAERNGAYFIPLQEKMEEYTSLGILGKDLFLDDCHPNFLGHKIIASVMMQALCDSNFIVCENENWRKWLDAFSGEMNNENLAKEYFLIGYYQFKGTVWSSEPNYSKALEYFNRAIKLDPKDKQVYGFLAATYWNLGEEIKAKEELRKLKDTSPEEWQSALERFAYLKDLDK